MLSFKPKGKGVSNDFIHLSSVSCLKMFLYLSVEEKLKIIASTGCTIIYLEIMSFQLVRNACREKNQFV